MRVAGYFITAIMAVFMVRTDSAILEVLGLALLFMAACNIGWTHADEGERRSI